MASCQREVRLVVVERGRAPRRGRVALQAIMVEVPGHMIRVRRAGIVILVTSITLGGQSLILVVDMALCACDCLMGTGEGELSRYMTER